MVTTRRRRVYTQRHRSGYFGAVRTQTEFCRRAKIQLSMFALWRRTLAGAPASSPTFAKVRLSAPGADCAATLYLPSGAKLELAAGTDAAWLGLVLKSVHS